MRHSDSVKLNRETWFLILNTKKNFFVCKSNRGQTKRSENVYGNYGNFLRLIFTGFKQSIVKVILKWDGKKNKIK